MSQQIIPPEGGTTVTTELDQLEAHLRAGLCAFVLDFRLCRDQDGVVLRGRARTYYAKQVAQHAVMRATQLPIRGNHIEVS